MHDLDWLRVLLFGLLIPYHAAIGFVSYAELVFGVGNDVRAGPELEAVLRFSHGFRLHALFMISGVGTWFAFRRRGVGAFVRERIGRLALPFLVGVYTVNLLAAGVRAAAAEEGFAPGALIADWFLAGPLAHSEHLWFLLSLLAYSLLAVPLIVLLRRRPDGAGVRAVRRVVRFGHGLPGLLLVPVPLLILLLATKPYALAFTGEGHKLPLFFAYFVLGYLHMQLAPDTRAVAARWAWLCLGLGLAVGWVREQLLAVAETLGEGYAGLIELGGWTGYGVAAYEPIATTATIAEAWMSWLTCVAVFGIGARYLNRSSRLLSALNQLVYPTYVWHMLFVTIGVAVASRLAWPWPLELLAVAVFAALASVGVARTLAATPVTRRMFGIKPRPASG